MIHTQKITDDPHGRFWRYGRFYIRHYPGDGEHGPGGMHEGHEATGPQAWAGARAAAVPVLGRLEVPGGGGQLAAALQGPRVLP